MTRARDPSERSCLAGVVAVGLVFFGPGFDGRWPVLRDLPSFLMPSRALWRQAVSAGRLPEWNPLVGLGVATTGAPVHGAFYPPHLLLLLGRSVSTVPALLAIHAVLAGLGAYALARSAGCKPLGASLAGVAWMLGGYGVSMWGNGEKVLSEAWVPFAAAGLVAYARAPSLRSPWLLAASGALALTALAGDPFLWFDAALLGVPLAVAAASAELPWGRAALRVLERGVIAVVLALLVAAPALVPAWLLRDDTLRAGDLSAGAAELWSMHPARLLELLAPGALGDPMTPESYLGARFADAPAVHALPWALSLYGGAVCAALPFVAGRTRVVGALAASAVLGALAALGRFTPFHAALRALVVPLRWARYPEKHELALALGLAVLAGLGFERARDDASLGARALAVYGGLAAVALAVAPGDLRGTLALGLLHGGVALLLVLAALRGAAREAWLAPVAVLLAAVDVGVASRPLIPWREETLNPRPEFVATMLRREHDAPPRVLRPHQGSATLDSLPGNLASMWGVAELPGHDPTRSVRLDQLAQRVGRAGAVKLSQLLRFEYALEPPPAGSSDDVPWTLRTGPRLARAWLVGSAEIVDDAVAIERLSAPDFDPQASAMLAPSPTASALSGDAKGECKVASFASERVELSCTSSGEALVVLAEAHAPGWTVTLDDHDAPLERADFVLRGVRIGAGAHRLVFSFATPGLRAALGAALAGLLLGWALTRGRGAWRAAATGDSTR